MLSLEERLAQLERRNAALEARDRRTRWAGLAAVVAAGAALLVAPAGAQDRARKAESLKARDITLVDDAGKTRLEIGVDKGGAGIAVRDAGGKLRVMLGEGAVEGPDPGAGLWVFDEKERPRVGLGVGKHGSGLIVLDEIGKPVAGEGQGQEKGQGNGKGDRPD